MLEMLDCERDLGRPCSGVGAVGSRDVDHVGERDSAILVILATSSVCVRAMPVSGASNSTHVITGHSHQEL